MIDLVGELLASLRRSPVGDAHVGGQLVRGHSYSAAFIGSSGSGPVILDSATYVAPGLPRGAPTACVYGRTFATGLGTLPTAAGYGQCFDVDTVNRQVFAFTNNNGVTVAEVTQAVYDQTTGRIISTSSLTWVPAAAIYESAVVVDASLRKGYFINIRAGTTTLDWRRYDLTTFGLDASGTLTLANNPGAQPVIVGMAYVTTGKVALAFADSSGNLVTVIISGLNGATPAIDNEQKDVTSAKWQTSGGTGVLLSSDAATALIFGAVGQVEVLTATPWTKTLRTASEVVFAYDGAHSYAGLLTIARGRDNKVGADNIIYLLFAPAADQQETQKFNRVLALKWNWSSRTLVAERMVDLPHLPGDAPYRAYANGVPFHSGGGGLRPSSAWGLDSAYIYTVVGIRGSTDTRESVWILRVPRF